MPEPTSPAETETFCQGCGYPLHSLPTPRCPECGRSFDPTDPRTMSLRRPLRAWQRRLLRPAGWPTAALAVLAAVAITSLSTWHWAPPPRWATLAGEFKLPSASAYAPRPRPPLTYAVLAFWTSVGAWCLCATAAGTLFLLRRLLVPAPARRADARPASAAVRRTVIAAALLSACSLLFGWQTRTAYRWVEWQLATGYASLQDVVPGLSAEERLGVCRAAVMNLPRARHRAAGLSVVAEYAGADALIIARQAFPRESDPSLRLTLFRLMVVGRDPVDVPAVVACLTDADPGVRATAADGVGIFRRTQDADHDPAAFQFAEGVPSIDASPPLDLYSVWLAGGLAAAHDRRIYRTPPLQDTVLRDRLEGMMLAGPTPAEREAAARTIVTWPPADYRLRVAEWGVWLDAGNVRTLTRAALDDIPPFVHQTGNSLAAIASEAARQSPRRRMTVIAKPVVHLSASVPLAADIEVHIRQGRPWFAYPRPDDFAIDTQPNLSGGEHPTSAFNPLAPGIGSRSPTFPFGDGELAGLEDLAEGYPWLSPHHRHRYLRGPIGLTGLYAVGLRWQSVILTPDVPVWSALPVVPTAAKFDWWTRLRRVPASYVTSRGETERFIYYDGPTAMPVPARVTLSDAGDLLSFVQPVPGPVKDKRRPLADPWRRADFRPLHGTVDVPDYDGLFIKVTAGVPAAQRVVPDFDRSVHVRVPLPIEGHANVRAEFRRMLIQYGLTDQEAEGLIETWSDQFFKTNGRRYLLRMSPADYAAQCPMQVRPTPTEVVRLGLVLTEFDAVP